MTNDPRGKMWKRLRFAGLAVLIALVAEAGEAIALTVVINTGTLGFARAITLTNTYLLLVALFIGVVGVSLGTLRGRGTLQVVALLSLAIATMEVSTEWLLSNSDSIPEPLIPGLAHYYESNDREVIQLLPECVLYDASLAYIMRPGNCTFSNREFSTNLEINSQGLRDEEESLRFPQVIALGDSYTMGWGVEEEEIWATHVERALGVRTLNAGISSYGTARELMMLERLSTDSLKAIVIQYHPTDLDENLALLENGHLPTLPPDEFAEAQEAAALIHPYFPAKHTVRLGKQAVRRVASTFAPTVANAASVAGPRDGEVLGKVLDLMWEDIPRVPIIIWSIDADGTGLGEFEGFEEAATAGLTEAQRALIKFVNVEAQLGRYDRFHLDEHLTAEGHRGVANILAEALGAIGLGVGTRPSS